MKKSALEKFYPETYKRDESDDWGRVRTYTNIEEEYNALRSGVGLIDGHGYQIIKITGEEAANFLESTTTKDVLFMNSGTINECYILDDDASILALVFLMRTDNAYYIFSPNDTGINIFEWLQDNIVDGAKIEDISDEMGLVFFEGPDAWKFVKKVFFVEVESLALRSFTDIVWNELKLSVARIGRSGEYSYAFFADQKTLCDIIEVCMNNNSEDEIKFVGTAALELCMLEIHQPNLQYETAQKGNIFELAQQWIVQYEKEDYIGAEKVKELFEQPIERLAVGFKCEDYLESLNDATISLEGDEVGSVLYSFVDSQKNYVLGIAMLDEEIAVSGIELAVETSSGTKEIKTLSSPFVRPTSWDQKIE